MYKKCLRKMRNRKFLFAIKNVAIGLEARYPLGGAGGGAAARAPLLQLGDS